MICTYSLKRKVVIYPADLREGESGIIVDWDFERIKGSRFHFVRGTLEVDHPNGYQWTKSQLEGYRRILGHRLRVEVRR